MRGILHQGLIAAALLLPLIVLAQDDERAARVAPCAACHGDQGRATTDGYYPRLAGKPAGYLYQQMLNFREARRTHAVMTYLLDFLPPAYLQEIAGYYASRHPPYPPPQTARASAAVLERGRQLVEQGDPARRLPSCRSCHGATLSGVAPGIPGLLGLPVDYLNAQLGAWKNGVRRATAPDCMADLVQRLSDADLAAASAWLAAQPVPSEYRPAPGVPAPLPLDCGSAQEPTP